MRTVKHFATFSMMSGVSVCIVCILHMSASNVICIRVYRTVRHLPKHYN